MNECVLLDVSRTSLLSFQGRKKKKSSLCRCEFLFFIVKDINLPKDEEKKLNKNCFVFQAIFFLSQCNVFSFFSHRWRLRFVVFICCRIETLYRKSSLTEMLLKAWRRRMRNPDTQLIATNSSCSMFKL